MKSIRQELTRRLLLALAVILGAGLIAIYFTTREVLMHSFDATLRARAVAVSALIEFEGGKIQTDFTADFLRGFAADHPRRYFEIWDSGHRVLTRSPSLQNADLPDQLAGSLERPRFFDFRLPNGRDGHAVAFDYSPAPGDPVSAAVRPVPSIRIVVAADRGELDRNLNGLLAAVVGGGVLFVLAVLWVVPRVLRRGLLPLNRLADQAARIDADTLASRFEAGAMPAELQPISERLNDLLARLERSFERERRFNADLAHELRTPIAELRSVAECALKWPDSRDPATDTDLLEIAVQMESLVSRMLTLARGERGELAASLAPVALSAVIAQTWETFAPRAAARQLRPVLALAPATVPADKVLLQSILGNLFDNAVAYAPAGSEVRITGATGGGGYTLVVSNLSAGLTAADLPNLFERFWRQEKSRTGGEHFGLGLCLARTFAQAMGWQLTARLGEGNRLEFLLTTGAVEKREAGR